MSLEKNVEQPNFLGRLKQHNEENKRIREKIKNYSKKEQEKYYEGYADAILHCERLHTYESVVRKEDDDETSM